MCETREKPPKRVTRGFEMTTCQRRQRDTKLQIKFIFFCGGSEKTNTFFANNIHFQYMFSHVVKIYAIMLCLNLKQTHLVNKYFVSSRWARSLLSPVKMSLPCKCLLGETTCRSVLHRSSPRAFSPTAIRLLPLRTHILHS